MKPQIIFEDKHILVCVKPAGIPTQSRQISTPDMVSILKNHLHSSGAKSKEPYLAVIHRLDQPVEGLLVFAKTSAAARSLNKQLQSFGFGKHYLAVLSVVPKEPETDLEDYMVKDGHANISRVCTPDIPGAKLARLHYKMIGVHDSFALAEITLDTGRHHQIRVQMAHIGCPIMGDTKYGPASSGTPHSPAGQLQLYAVNLNFRHPATNIPLSFHHTPQLPFPSVS